MRPIVLVSGVPRSGTSLMMQMLRAGGMPVLTDGTRQPDEDNPHGYFELESVKQTRNDQSWLDQAAGRAVKVIHLILSELPLDREYRVIFMHRNLDEVVRSQATMLARGGRAAPSLAPERLKDVFASQVRTALARLAESSSVHVLELQYADVIADPHQQAERVSRFLGGDLDVQAMARCVDANLYRNRQP